jgi:hypothetical protein
MKKVKTTHTHTEIADQRDKIANELSEDEIIIQTLYNALKLPNANLSEKLIIALSTIPETRSNFSKAKNRFLSLLDSLEINGKVTSEDIMLLKHSVQTLNSFQELITKRSEIDN